MEVSTPATDVPSTPLPVKDGAGITVYDAALRPIVTTTWFLTGVNPSDNRVYLAIGNPPQSLWLLFDNNDVIDRIVSALTAMRGKQ